jgi:DNA (cytosine-5)-methyltransferase 1
MVSLFAGCGGMDLGAMGGFQFQKRRYARHPIEVVHASDIDERVVDIYNQNFDHQATVSDVRDLDAAHLPGHDILTGGFPCQSFSISAQNPKRLGYKDERGQLFFEIKRILSEKQPRAFVAENVKGIISANSREAFPLILDEFRAAGYSVYWSLLNASHYGVPQKRERVFIVGFRNKTAGNRFRFPLPVTVSNPPVLRSVIQPDVDEKYFFSDKAVLGMKTTRNSKSMNKGRAQDLNMPCNTVSTHLAKVSLNSTDPVLRVGSRYRMFTPREVARIQSFPDSFKLETTRTAAYFGLGNAVPPVLMWHVMGEVIRALRPTSRSPQ